MKGKGRMTENLGHDDPTYHEYLQRQVYAEYLGLNSPQPSLNISEPDPNATPHLTSQSENMPNTSPNFEFDLHMEEKLQKQAKSDLFVLHIKKVRKKIEAL